mmetsp:Transcript_24186/g.67915  ORF Transcript_24186/g.67915 Transcript_24186/m.67915 type:complete len:154 (-) Transcript_24186:153-614(-)
MSPSIPKASILPEKWAGAIYGAPEACLAKPETTKLAAMQFDPNYWSRAYTQCLGRGLSHKECAASIPDDARVTPPGPLSSEGKALAAAIACMSENGSAERCASHFDDLRKLAGYEEPAEKSATDKVSGFCSKAGFKMLALPVVLVGLKFIRIK